MKGLSGLILLLFIAIAFPCPAWTEDLQKNGTLSFVLENDLFYNVDRHYTNGVGLMWVPARDVSAPEWAVRLARLVPWFHERGGIRHGYAFGQSMFTSSDINVKNPPLRDHPYAGWLYGAIGLGVESGKQLDLLGITFGLVGPVSLAEQSQKFVHKIVGADDPQGWDTQLGNEPGLVVTYQRSWRCLVARTVCGNRLDLTPHVGVTFGNVFTYGNAGATVRYGRRLPDDYGPPRIQPGLPGSGYFSPICGFGWYLFAGMEGRAVARNIFLDGNTFRDSRSVDKRPLVGDLQLGVVVDWSDIRLSYTHVLRTREFRTQDGNSDFGAITVSVEF
ncbi:MAG: lipid A deacylase LpxR family protein [Deltaproteobacteria bacterium]|nr:lipid A deacylase LpxR family protein [Deltaproteobacteria bacterium]